MKLYLKRYKTPTYCIGKLLIDGVKFCDVLEDTDRGLTQSMSLSEIKKKKVSGKTAIPTGTYEITLNIISPRFSKRRFYQNVCKGRVPRLLNVPGFDGILIHVGNTPAHTQGCLLVGNNIKKGMVLNSMATFKSLYKKLKSAADKGEKITITIE